RPHAARCRNGQLETDRRCRAPDPARRHAHRQDRERAGVMRWWARLLRRNRVERELDAELRYDFDRRVDDFVAAGMTAEDARRAARLEFGGLDQIKERCRDARGTRWVEDLAADTRYALRLLRKDPAFAAVAIVALGLGLAVFSTQFAIVEAY